MSLIAWYPLDGDILDYSQNGGVLASVGTPASETGGKIGDTVDFNAGYYTTNSSTLDLHLNLTITFWVKLDAYPVSRFGIMETAYGAEFAINIDDAGALQWYYGTSGSETSPYVAFNTSSGVVEVGNWVHIALVRNLRTNKIYYYKNGIELTSNTLAYIPTPTTNNLLKIGYAYTGGLQGNLNDVRYYDNALSAKEIKEIAKAKVLDYSFNDFQEPTTNIYSATSKNFTESLVNYPIPPPSLTLVNGGYWTDLSWSGDITLPGTYNTGDVVTFSGYYMPYTTNLADVITASAGIQMYGSTGGLGHTTSPTEWNIWYYFEFTETFVADGVTSVRIEDRGYDYYNPTEAPDTSAYWSNIQIEHKDHATPFTPTSRTGTVRDGTGFRNDATMNPDYSPKWQEIAKLGTGSYLFNNQRILSNSGLKLTDTITLAAWVKLDTIRESGFIQSDFYLSCDSSGHLRTYWYDTSSPGYHVSPNILPQDEWIHVAAVWTGTQAILYENAVEVRRVDSTTPGRGTVTYTAFGVEGTTNPPTSSRKLDGSMDDVRIYATALSQDDITELYQTRAQLDDAGNLFLNELTTNGFQPTIINYTTWVIGSSGSQTGFSKNGTDAENSIITKLNPISVNDVVWASLSNDGVSDADGGWNTASFSIDNTKAYRFTTWIRRENAGTGDGTTYLGCHGYGTVNGVSLIGGAPITNPYFKTDSSGLTWDSEWTLWVAYVMPYGTATEPTYITDAKGVWDIDGTRLSSTMTSYVWLNESTTANFRSYLFYSIKTDERMYWYRPRVEAIDGSELPLNDLFNCSEHRALINEADEYDYDEYNISDTGIGKFGDLTEVGVANGLVGYWKLNGDAKDYSENGNDGTITGAVVSSGLKNLAYDFAYTTDKIRVSPAPPTSTNFTISAWVYSNNIGNSQNIVSRNSPYFMRIVGSKVRFNVLAGSWLFQAGTTTLLSDTWYFLSMTFDGATFKGYINDEEEFSVSKVGTVGTGADYVDIGYTAVAGENSPMDGKIADVRIYNRTLSLEEIVISYKYGLPTTGMQLASNGTLYTNKEIIEEL